MRSDETILHHHSRQHHFRILSHLESDEGVVVSLLRALAENLDPARVSHHHGVSVIAVDVDRRGKRPARDGHHDRQARTGSDIHDFRHERESLGGRRGHSPPARCRRPHDRRHGAVLRLDINELSVHVSVRHELGERVDDGGLRRDRIDRRHLRIYLAHGMGRSLPASERFILLLICLLDSFRGHGYMLFFSIFLLYHHLEIKKMKASCFPTFLCPVF